jgi:hypothetical protein
MQAVDTRINGKDHKQAKGRKGADKQAAVIEVAELKKRMPQLVKLKKAHDETGEGLNSAITKAAEESGLLASVVRKAVVASAGEDFEGKHREVTQLSLAFEALA